MISVVVPAHNEADVLPRLLDALRPGIDDATLHVIVVANGCDDDTASVARAAGTDVVELPAGDKIQALNAGDDRAQGFPRFYIDADVVIGAADLAHMAARLDDVGVEAVAPGLRLRAEHSGALVRSYHRYWARLPTVRHSLAGRGCFGVTAAGRARWDRFPTVVADDQFVNQMFSPDEVAVDETVTSAVTPPASLRALVARKRRSHRGNLDLAGRGATTATSRVRWLEVLRTEPRRVADLPAFLLVTALVRSAAWRDVRDGRADWGSDATSRTAA